MIGLERSWKVPWSCFLNSAVLGTVASLLWFAAVVLLLPLESSRYRFPLVGLLVVPKMEEKRRHLAVKASFEARRPLSGVVFREESKFEVKMAPNKQNTSFSKHFHKL